MCTPTPPPSSKRFCVRVCTLGGVLWCMGVVGRRGQGGVYGCAHPPTPPPRWRVRVCTPIRPSGGWACTPVHATLGEEGWVPKVPKVACTGVHAHLLQGSGRAHPYTLPWGRGLGVTPPPRWCVRVCTPIPLQGGGRALSVMSKQKIYNANFDDYWPFDKIESHQN